MADADVFDRFPDVRIDGDNVAHYRGRLERRLLLNRCRLCLTWHAPPRAVCHKCLAWDVSPEEVSGFGIVALLTLLYQSAPVAGVEASEPVPLATVELDEQPGLRFTAVMVGCDRDQLRIGLPVELAWIEDGGPPLPVFRPRDGNKRR